MNRGLSKRPVFLGRPEIRYFESRLAREVRAGEIEVHAFCFLTTHFHLLLRSPRGHLSDVMRRVENAFVRWFNRRHGRDGSLFRGRFTSRHVDSDTYLENVIGYIDHNPVSAGIVSSAEAYPHGSARFSIRESAPPWFSLGPAAPTPGPHAQWVIERRLERPTATIPLDDLVGSTTGKVRHWMSRKALLADGTRLATCLISPEALQLALTIARERHGNWLVTPRSRDKDGWGVLAIGLSRDVVGLSIDETSLALAVARSSAGHGLLEHQRLLLADSTYRDRAAEVLHRGLEITYGGAGTRDDPARLECVVDRA